MDWTADELKIDQALRELPLVNISARRQMEINQVLQERVKRINQKNRKRMFIKATGFVAGIASLLTIGIFSFYQVHSKPNGLTSEMVVQGTSPAPVSLGFQVPKTISTSNWTITMAKSNSDTFINSNNTGQRYNFRITYIGNSSVADNVSIVEKGIGIWSPEGNIINSNVFNAGNVSSTVGYQDFTVLKDVQKVEFNISWEAGGKKYSEQITFPRK